VAGRLRYAVAATPLGELIVVAAESGVAATFFGDAGEDDAAALGAHPDRRGLGGALDELGAYFAGELRSFTTPVDRSFASEGFPRRVIDATLAVPYGELRTYGDIADAAGAPRAGRAAGSVLARCPVEIFIPCHRVVSAGRSLGGYGAHPERKAFLVELEARAERGAGR
jgi:methylated-DNA-[protein]-cysteine S-methyltransferase